MIFKKLQLLSLAVLTNQIALADIFYSETIETKAPTTEPSTNFDNNLLSCKSTIEKPHIIQENFDNLKFVGIIKKDNQIKALFLNANNNIIDVKANDFIGSMDIQVIEITLSEITYVNWAKSVDCNNLNKITLRL